MTLEGWVTNLPSWIMTEIEKGALTVHQGKGFQYLQGKVTNPQGTVIWFM